MSRDARVQASGGATEVMLEEVAAHLIHIDQTGAAATAAVLRTSAGHLRVSGMANR
jgi:hypothetical protein